MKNGYISLFRKLIDWEWYKDGNTMRVFVHCLLSVTHQDYRSKGITIKKGTFYTSRDSLAKALGLSEQNVRTALKNLTRTNDISIETTNKNTIIKVCNWDRYQQLANQQTNQLESNSNEDLTEFPTNNLTNSQPATNQQNLEKMQNFNQQTNQLESNSQLNINSFSNQQPNQQSTSKNTKNSENLTTYNNNNNILNKNILYGETEKRKIFKKPTIEEIENYCKENEIFSIDANQFYDYYEANGWMIGKNKMKDWQATLRNWNRKNKKESIETNNGKPKTYNPNL